MNNAASLKDLFILGGWRSERTVLECYQTTDLEALREARKQRRAVGEPTQ